MVKNLPANARDTGNVDSTPGSGIFPGESNAKPLQYSSLENPRNSGVHYMGSQRVDLTERLSTENDLICCALIITFL